MTMILLRMNYHWWLTYDNDYVKNELPLVASNAFGLIWVD